MVMWLSSYSPVTRPVEVLRQEPLGYGHPDGVGEALPQRSRRGLDPGGVAALGVPGRARAPLPERLELLQRQVVAAEVEQRVEQHGGVAAGEHEPVAIGPVGVGGV